MKRTIKNLFPAPTDSRTGGARLGARMLPAPTHLRRLFVALVALLSMTAQTAWADDVTLTEDTDETEGTAARWYVNMPKTDTNTLTLDGNITTFKVYDDGGKGGKYSYNCNGTLILTAPSGYVLQLSGSINAETHTDELTVYDGSNNNATKLLDAVSSTSVNTQTAITTVTSSGQNMMLYFKSDGSSNSNYAGLDLTVTLVSTSTEYGITVNNATGGTVTASVSNASATTARVNDVVTLTATPSDGYMLSSINVTDASNNAIAVTDMLWYANTNTATFTMLGSAVTVAPTFTNTLTADGGLYINMPATGTQSVTIPTGVKSFKVYDDGGASGNYSDNCSGTLTLTAPEGYLLQLSGNINTQSGKDKLTVYDGSNANGTKLLNEVNGSTAISTVTSSSQSMTLYFSSNDFYNYAGLDLTVTLVNPNEGNAITINTATGGSVASDKTRAKVNDVVTLTATPSEGYVFSGLSVTYGNSNAVAVTGGWYTNNQATFTMPGSAVTVTPAFTNDQTSLFVNMPTTDTQSVTIPTGVQSFKVYDDGGASGNYSNNCKGTLVLTAPEGYVLQLSGSITTEPGFDKLTVYDGSDANGTKLLDEVSSTNYGTQTAITTVTSSGQSMTLYFYSTVGTSYSGLNLTVTLVNANTESGITVNTATGGSVAATVGGTSATKAKVNDVVTLTATPESGYLLSGLSVTDGSSNAVAVAWDGPFFNTATFTMPGSAVTVTPAFTNDLTSLSVNMPTTGKQSVTIPTGVQSFKVYDDGGASGNYSDYCDGTLVLTAPSGYVLQLSGSITTEKVDKLTVYDGTDNTDNTATKLLNEVSSTSSNIQTAISTVTSRGQSMTLYFSSNSNFNYAGLDLTVTVVSTNAEYAVTVNTATGGSVASDKTQAKVNDVVTLTATPSEGYMFSGLSVTYGSSNAVAVAWDGPFFNTATFTMPGSAVTVTPAFTNTLTADGGLYINMPTTDTQSVTIPTGVQSFKVYDDGGASGNYSDNCNGTLILTAPEGYVLQLSGSITTAKGDELTVYDGTGTDNTATTVSSTSSEIQTAISTVTSSGQSMTLYFSSNRSWNCAGLDLTVTVVNPNPGNAIIVSSVTGGSVAASVSGTSVSTAKADDVVTLTVTPETGYLLSDLSVVDANNSTVSVDWNLWANTATFTMPSTAVTVKPTFTNNLTNLFINMPTTGTKTATIPATVQSFKVYDDGGNAVGSGYYSDGCNGYLIINAPSGYGLKVEGYANLKNDSETLKDYLTVYDGAYDGTGTAPAYLGEKEKYGQRITIDGEDIGTLFSTGSVMTLYFKSDNDSYSTFEGLNLTVTLVPLTPRDITIADNITGGSMTANPTSATYRSTVSLSATCNDGYALNDLVVTDGNSNKVDVDWAPFANSATFSMPATAVNVTPTFSSAKTAADGLYVRMPLSGHKTANIPSGVTSFKLYDDGGPNNPYSNDWNSVLTLVAPEGYRFDVEGSVVKSSSTDEGFYIFDCDNTSHSQISYALVNNNLNRTYSSTDRYLTFWFQGAYVNNDNAGLDLTVTLVANPEHTVTVSNPTEGGTMTATPAKAKYNTDVTLSATPAPGYQLFTVSVKDADNNTVLDTKIDANTYKFAMPASDVTVTPTFTPIDYNITLAEGIPQGAVSFSKSKANLDEVVTLTINGGYSYSDLTVTCNGSGVTLTEVSDTEYTFKMPEGDVVVSATFTANSYTVVFDKNADDATGDAMDSQQFTYGTAQNLTTSTFARTGYTFEGWATEATGEKVYSDGQDGSVISAAQGATVTLYAVWKGVDYTVSFNKNAGSLSISGSMADQAFTYGTEQALTQNAFTCPPGYSFAGWATSAGGEKVYNDEQPVNNLTTTAGATITLYAKWAYSGWTSELQTDAEEAEGTAGRYYVNMPVNGSQTFTIPAENGVPTMNGKVLKSFKLYDNGGKGGSSNWSSDVPNGNYTPGYPSQLTITAPEGYRLRVDGDVNLVYKTNNVSHRFELTNVEGTAVTSTLVSISGGVLSGQGSISLGHQSTGNSMMFSIVSDGVNNQNYSHSGVDVTVTIYKVDEEYHVNQADNLHGTVTKSATTGKYRDEITLTCGTPDECYEAVTPITYTYLGNDGIMLTGTTAANGKFSMPNSDVTITQAFQPKSSGGMTITSANGEVTASFNDAVEEGLNIPSTIEVDHVTIGRTYESGKASTVYLPFSIAAANVSGGTFYTFTGVDETTTPWTVNYSKVSGDIQASTPYIFLPDGTNDGKIVVDNGSNMISVCTADPHTTKQGQWEFIGTYKYIQWLSDNDRASEIGLVYGFAAENKTVGETSYEVGQFVKIGSGAFINPMRAYLKRSATAGARTLSRGNAESLPETMTVVLRDANGEATNIGTFSLDHETGEWYSLDGRKLSGKPTAKGLYINNGKKVVIK